MPTHYRPARRCVLHPLFPILIALCALTALAAPPLRPMERLGRGVVAVYRGDGVFVSWRLLGTEPQDTAFNVYRQTGDAKPRLLNEKPLTGGTNLFDNPGRDIGKTNAYTVRAVVDGVEQPPCPPFVLPASPPDREYLEIPLRPFEKTYVHPAWVGDLDGDGEYDYLIDRLPRDNPSFTQKLEAYRRDGRFLWAADFGPRSGNPEGARWNTPPAVVSNGHNDGVTVYDLDLDGRAEVIIKSAQGVVFGDGKTLEEGDDVMQFISVLDGMTGAELARAPVPQDLAANGPVAGHFGIAYLDGVHPSIVFKAKNRRPDRGPFDLMTNTWTYAPGKLTHVWKWVRPDGPYADAHQIRIADVDGDGRDEICEMGFVLDDDGTVLYSMPDIVHGDRFHIGDLDPDRPGLEGFGVQQKNPSLLHLYYYDAATGEILRKHNGTTLADIGRGIAADIDPAHRGYEYWAFSGIFNCQTGELLSPEPKRPWPNFRIWWDGDVGSENLNQTRVEKWDPEAQATRILLKASRDGAVKLWRDAPLFYGDIMGDWREEVIWPDRDFTKLMVYTTTIPSSVRLYTLPHNPAYRACMTVKGYMQSHMVDYYLGYGMVPPPVPRITTR